MEIDNVNKYEHGSILVISGDIVIPHGNPTENCKDNVLLILATFKHELI